MKKQKTFSAFLFVVLGLLWGSATAYAGKLVRFTSPAPASQVSNGSTTVSLGLDATADPSTLKIVANGKDVTDQFRTSACTSTPCTLSATLNLSNGGVPGWNYLTATVTGPGGSASSARSNFFSGTGSPSVSLAPRRAGSPAVAQDQPIFPPNYYPPYTVHLYTTQSGEICVFTLCQPPTSSGLFIWIMARDTLTVTYTGNDPSVLKAADTNSTVIVTGTGTSAQGIDFSPVGGTDFTKPGALAPYNYNMVGSGGAQSGSAYESYNTSANTPWHGLQGNLVNYGRNTPLYTFVPDDNPGFVVQPGATQSTITIGAVQNFKIGSVPPPNQQVPPGFTSTQYTSPDMGGASGGFWVLVLDEFTLQPVSSTFYGTNCPSCTGANTSQSEVGRMSSDIGEILNGSLEYPTAPESHPVVFVTTVGTPFNLSNVASDFQGEPAGDLTQSIWNLGASWYAFNDLTAASSPSFSMVGVPGTNVDKGGNAYTQYSSGNNPQAAKWFSTTVDGDTGALKGILNRNNQFTFSPSNVGTFDVSTVPSNPTADDLLEFALIYQLGASQPVYFPTGNPNAYLYLSSQIISQDFYGGAGCGAPTQVCNDVHFYYTGDQVDGIIHGVDPRQIPYPGDGLGFSQQDFNAVAQQFNTERIYLSNVRNYEKWVEDVETNGSINVGTALTSAATEVATQLNQVTGVPQSAVPTSKMHLAIDMLNYTASIGSIIGVADPAVGVVSGILSTAANIMTTGVDLNGTAPTPPDPYVTQLGDLLGSAAGQATSAAVKFNSELEVSTGSFFNSVYGDWFRLQTVGLLTVNPDNHDWYVANAGTASASYTPTLIASARRNFYVQILPQYFEILWLTDSPTSYLLSQGKTQQQVDEMAAAHFNANLVTNGTSYSWYNRNSPGLSGCQDYTFIVLSSSVSINSGSSNFTNAKAWSNSIGNALMGPASGSDGLGSLNLNRNFFYDDRILNIAYVGQDPDMKAGMCGPATSSSVGGIEDQRKTTITQLTAAAGSVATGSKVNLHISVNNTDSSTSVTPTGFVHILQGNNIIGNIALAADHEVDYTLDTALLAPGTNQIVADYRGDGAHVNSASAAVAINVGNPAFTITPAQTTVNLSSKPNSQAMVNISLASSFSFTAPVQFSCSNVPQYVLCTFSNKELVGQDKPQTTTAVFTMIGTLPGASPQATTMGSMYRRFALATSISMAGIVFFFPKGRRTPWTALVLLLVATIGASGCSGNGPSTPTPTPTPTINPVTTTVTINATSTGFIQSQQIQLTVQ